MNNICATCGTRYSVELPAVCVICADDRQYVTEKGQVWTSHGQIARDHAVHVTEMAPSLVSLRITPSFAIGQRAFLVQTGEGNILWDCIPLLDEPTRAYLERTGGLRAIAISHPHYYSLMVPYARHFGCPVFLHEADRPWIMDPDDTVLKTWTGSNLPLWEGIRVYHAGGHFPGSTLLHLPDHGNGTLLCGDTLLVARDRKRVTAMYSYPNLIPLGREAIDRILEVVRPLRYGALYAAFEGQDLPENASGIVVASLERYRSIIGG